MKKYKIAALLMLVHEVIMDLSDLSDLLERSAYGKTACGD